MAREVINMGRSSVYTGPLRREIILDAMKAIQVLINKNRAECLVLNKEVASRDCGRVDDGNVFTAWVSAFIEATPWQSLFSNKSPFLFRTILRVKDFAYVEQQESLICELFVLNLRVKCFADCVLEPLAKELGYSCVEYVDMSRDPSAWYPDERPELPKARILNV